MRRVLFLPGVGGAGAFWEPVGELLPAGWSKRYLSWPGLGDQPADPNVHGFDDLLGIVTRHLEEPSDLVAQSMGGLLAVLAALHSPQRVRRLVLVATSGGLDVTSLGAIDWREDYRRDYPHAPAWVYTYRPDLTNQLSSITAPTLLIWGDADPISPPQVGRQLLQHLPDATLKIIPGGAHALAVEHSAHVADLIAHHLDQDANH